MANSKPFFLTGANAKIKLNGLVVAFATDISYSVSVRHASPRVLGRFEVETHQPLTYDVEGTFTVIRYAKGLKRVLEREVAGAAPEAVSNEGNSIGSFQTNKSILGSVLNLPGADGQFDGRAYEALIPGRMFQSSLFDIEISQKVGNGGECAIVKLQDCRITDANFAMNKKSPAMQTFKFKARYAHEDAFIARKSGVGQELV